MTGNIPSDLAKMTGLQVLKLDENLFTGPIPTELASLSSLSNLVLRGNQLSGLIPADFENVSISFSNVNLDFPFFLHSLFLPSTAK